MKKVKKNHQERGLPHTQPNPPADDAKAVIVRLDAATKWPKSLGWALTYTGRTDTVIDGKAHYAYQVDAERVTSGRQYRERTRSR